MSTFTPTRPGNPTAEWGDLPDPDRARAELLESLPARLEPTALATVMELHDQGKTPRRIGTLLHLDVLVVSIEIRRELERRAQSRPLHTAAVVGDRGTDGLALLTRREMNRLAKGSHIPNNELRAIVDRLLRRQPDLKLTALLRKARIKDVSQGKRLLGYAPYSGTDRPAATISVEHATRLLDAVGCDPVDVAGL